MIGWDRPVLPCAVDPFVTFAARDAGWDFSSTLVVLPTQHAIRQFLALLVDRAETAGAILVPPVLATPGELDRHLLPLAGNLARSIDQLLCWTAVLRSAEPTILADLIRRPPAADDTRGWRRFARLLVELRSLLIINGHSFERVASRTEIDGTRLEASWKALAKLEEAYRQLLASAGRIDPDERRENAITEHQASWAGKVVLIATVDLNRQQRALLEEVSRGGAEILSLIAASEERAEGFDFAGCLVPGEWSVRPLPLESVPVTVVQGPRDQARAAVAKLLEIVLEVAQDRPEGDVTIGAPDLEVVPRLLDVADRLKLPLDAWDASRQGEGVPLQLLGLLVTYARGRRAEDLARLVRHPDLHAALAEDQPSGPLGQQLIAQLDRFRQAKLASTIDPLDLAGEPWKKLDELVERRWEGRHSVTEWVRLFRETLVKLYRDPMSEEVQEELRDLAGALNEASNIPDVLGADLSASEAIEIVTMLAGRTRRARGRSPFRVLGWLDLPLDTAESLVLTGMNEGVLTGGSTSSPWLTPSLGQSLDLPGGQDREARNRYYFELLLRSRRRVEIILGRTTADRDPLIPKSWLLSGTCTERAARAKRLMSSPVARFAEPRPGGPAYRVSVPSIESAAGPDELPVTAFRDYLICPYRFYLRHVLKLRSVDDSARELDRGAFGSLLHRVLQNFGRSRYRLSNDRGEIQRFLEDALAAEAEEDYARRVPAVEIQLEQMRFRLEAFAEWQADWAGQGWQTILVEAEPPKRTARINAGSEPFFLSGRIDRVDLNQKTGQVAILDFKTKDSAEKPEKVHRPRGEWIDLQLPLYRKLLAAVRNIDLPSDWEMRIALGYVVLPKDRAEVGALLAEWSEEDLREADAAAERIAVAIRLGHFQERTRGEVSKYPEFARLCLEGMQVHD